MHRNLKKRERAKAIFWLVIGASFVAFGLEGFLVPNKLVDGGVVGIALMLSYITKWSFGLILIVLNLPFLYFGYKFIGKTFAAYTFLATILLALSTQFVHFMQPVVTNDVLLSAIFGGIFLGMGVGLIVRSGGALDGTEIVAIYLDKKSGFTVGEIVMFFNIFILSATGMIFSWDIAMYSLLTYFIAFKVIDITIEGLDESKSIFIITEKQIEIVAAIQDRLGRTCTIWQGQGGFSGDNKTIIYTIVTRLEITKLKTIVREFDDDAFVTVGIIHEVMGGAVKKRYIH